MRGLQILGGLVAAALLAGARPSSALEIGAIAGVYIHTFQDGLVDGTKYTGEEILEVVAVDPATAYVRTHLDAYNGHVCDLWGIAVLERDRLVYRPAQDIPDGPCEFSLSVKDGKIVYGDKDGHCRSYYCGARGSLDGMSFPLSRRRPIRYMDRLLKSHEYGDAMAEHRTGKAPG